MPLRVVFDNPKTVVRHEYCPGPANTCWANPLVTVSENRDCDTAPSCHALMPSLVDVRRPERLEAPADDRDESRVALDDAVDDEQRAAPPDFVIRLVAFA
ncbi:MAG: hypothetical protein M3081_20620 [Gemmatimonadota bacterium]|nr:hypothetical protein [Gemmatimonadota bacterium]